ncbi:MAG: hypothetical protein U9R38_00375, partial [Candidatus Margulisiibacteriota bacterium]|nr:hypothetical protein [Candidatus Margulisiibacteriota bacterium]
MKPARRYEDRLIPVKSTLFLYKTVTGMPGDIKDPQVLLEVPLKHEGKDYFYHYPIDLNYLFSPQWRLDNKASPFGFFRWAVEMDTAVRLGVIRDYKGCRIMESILSKASGKAKKLEGKECKYKSIQATRSKSLTLHTLLFHLEINGLLDTLKGNHNQIALAEEIGISHLSQLFSALSALKDPKTNKPWTEVLGYNYIDLPVKTVKELEKELRKGHSSYIGNHNQIALAEEIGIS